MVNDPRVDVTMLPVFDGVSMIKWKVDDSNRTGNSVDGLVGEKGNANGDYRGGVHADGVTNGGSGDGANGNVDVDAANGTADK